MRERGGGPDYGALDRLLHHLALGPRFVRETTFDLEQAFTKPDLEAVDARRHVFVAGLARAGTTLLLRALHRTGRFRTLSYRDMPFVLMPNLWRRMSAGFRKGGAVSERGHGDGITVDFDSPEAFEEVFWLTFARRDYVREDRLVPHRVGPGLRGTFRDFVGVLLKGTPVAYLSKNNNNLLRVRGVLDACPRAIAVVPFRHPLQQAASLLEQHLRWIRLHGEDPFGRKYMSWLGHFDFGSDHRPAVYSEGADPQDWGTAGSLQYWLHQWLETYGHALQHAGDRTVFVGYEGFCGAPERTLETILGRREEAHGGAAAEVRPARVREVDSSGIDPEILARAEKCHARLVKRADHDLTPLPDTD